MRALLYRASDLRLHNIRLRTLLGPTRSRETASRDGQRPCQPCQILFKDGTLARQLVLMMMLMLKLGVGEAGAVSMP